MSYGQVLTDLITTSDGVSSAGLYGLKNRLINGDMKIDQRNAGAEVNPAVNAAYYLDRWVVQSTQTSKFKIGQNAGSAALPVGFTKYLGCTSLSAYSVTSSDVFSVQQKIEGLNCSDLAWGTASAATVTLSFWVQSSLTGTFGGALRNSDNTRTYPFSYTISSANTWELKSVTIAGDTSGTWLTTNGVGIVLNFSLGTGSTLSGTAGSWSGSDYRSATGATSVVGTSGATFYITGIQLEKGSTATSFDYRPYGTELQLCQRYCVQWNGTGVPYLTGQVNASTVCYSTIPYAMRATPTAAYLSLNANDAAVSNSVTSISGLIMNGSGGGFIANSTGLTIGRCAMIIGAGSTSYLRFDAEL